MIFGLMKREAIIYEHRYMSWPTWHLKNVFCKMACGKIRWLVEYVPLVPTFSRQTIDHQDPRAVGNSTPILPASRPLTLSKNELAAINRNDDNVFPKHNFRTKLREVELFVRDKPMVEPCDPDMSIEEIGWSADYG